MLRYLFQNCNYQEFRYIYYFVEYIVDAYVVVLRHLVGMGLLVHEAQVFGVELLETVFSLSPAHHKHSDAVNLNEELLFVFPVINLVSSPSKSVKQAAIDLLSILEKLLINLLVSPKKELIMQGRFPSITRPEDIIFRLLRHWWSQHCIALAQVFGVGSTHVLTDAVDKHETSEALDQPFLPSSFLLNFASNDGTDLNNMHNVPKTWTSLMREYSMWILERRKSSLPISRSRDLSCRNAFITKCNCQHFGHAW